MATSFLSSETGRFYNISAKSPLDTLRPECFTSETKNGFSSVVLHKPHTFKAPGEPTNTSLRKGRRVTGGYDFCYVLFLVLLCFGLEFQEKIAVSSYIFERAPPLVKGGVYFF